MAKILYLGERHIVQSSFLMKIIKLCQLWNQVEGNCIPPYVGLIAGVITSHIDVRTSHTCSNTSRISHHVLTFVALHMMFMDIADDY